MTEITLIWDSEPSDGSDPEDSDGDGRRADGLGRERGNLSLKRSNELPLDQKPSAMPGMVSRAVIGMVEEESGMITGGAGGGEEDGLDDDDP